MGHGVHAQGTWPNDPRTLPSWGGAGSCLYERSVNGGRKTLPSVPSDPRLVDEGARRSQVPLHLGGDLVAFGPGRT